MTSTFFNRRMLMGRLAAVLPLWASGRSLAATARSQEQGLGRAQTES